MSLLGHFLAADLRRFRLPILLWIVLFVAAAIPRAVVPSFIDGLTHDRAFAMVVSLLRFADVMLAVALVAFVIQSHSLVGSDAFWMTRPVRWSTLLASKLVLLGMLLVGVPVLIDVIHMAVYGMPFTQIGLGALQVAIFRTLALLLVMVAAAVTPNGARFTVVCVGLVVAVSVIPVFARSLLDESTYRFGVMLSEASQRGHDLTWLVVACVLGAGASLSLLAVQYRSRMRRRSIAIGIVGAIVAIAAGWAWRWPLLTARVTPPAWAQAAGALELSGDADSVHFEPVPHGTDLESGWTLGRSYVRVSGVRPGWVAAAKLAAGSLEHGGGRLVSAGYTFSDSLPFADRNVDEAPLPSTARDVLGVARLGVTHVGATGPRAVVFVVRNDAVESADAAHGVYRGDFSVSLNRMEIAGVLPLKAGASFQDGAYEIHIDAIRRGASGLRLIATSLNVRTIFDRAAEPMYSFFLRNTERAEASEASVQDMRPLFPSAPIPPSSAFTISHGDLYFPEIYRWPEVGLLEMDDAWLRAAELVILRTIDDGSVRRTLTMKDVIVRRPPGGRSRRQ